MPGNDLVEICPETLRMGEFTGDEDVRDDSFIELALLHDVTNFLQIYADSLINIAYNHIVMNRIKPLWVGSICLTILLSFLCACSTTTGNKTPSAQAGTGATGATAMEDQIAQAVFQTINQSRAANGLPPLKWSTALANSARQHDLTMQAANTLSHQLSGEAAFGDRERQQGINWSWAAENIGETSDLTNNGALGLHRAMMSEQPPNDGHRQNILTTRGNIAGVAILIDQQHGELWLTEDFAQV